MILSFETFRKLTYCMLCQQYIGVYTCVGTFVARTENAWLEYVVDNTSRNWDSCYGMCLIVTLNKKRGCSMPSNLTLLWRGNVMFCVNFVWNWHVCWCFITYRYTVLQSCCVWHSSDRCQTHLEVVKITSWNTRSNSIYFRWRNSPNWLWMY